jgi:hypothetical protein
MITLRFAAAHVCVTNAIGEPILLPGPHREVRVYLDVGARTYTFSRGACACLVDSAGGVRLGTRTGAPTWGGALPSAVSRIPSPYYELRVTGAAVVRTDADGCLVLSLDDDLATSLGHDQGLVALLCGLGGQEVTVTGEGISTAAPVSTVAFH